LGGSIGLAAKEYGSAEEVVGYGHRPETLKEALQLGAVDRVTGGAAEAVKGADLVILCTPVGLFRSILLEIAQSLKPGAIVTDVGSTKRGVVGIAEEILPKTVQFVGSHPMAGSEKRGVRHASADLFEGAVCIMTPTPHTNPAAWEKVESFWRRLGMSTVRLSPEEHDRRLADVSHLPHALAAALVTMQEDASLPLAGKGFRDLTRVAAGDGGIWRDILLENRDNLRRSAQQLKHHLDELLARLDAGDAESVREWLDAAAARRRSLDADPA